MAAQVVTEADGQLYAPDLLEEHAGYIRAIRDDYTFASAGIGTLWQRLGSEHGPVTGGGQVMSGKRYRNGLTVWSATQGMHVEGRNRGKARY